MRKTLLLLAGVFTLPCLAAVNVPLTIQETLYSGSVPGVNRSADPVTVGVPLPDDPATGITSIDQLTLSGASIGQFRVLGRWPSGRIKWVLVDTQATLSAGSRATITLANGGSGNFGAANLATDTGATIVVSTGSAQFTIRKSNFNVLDQVVVGSKVLISSGSSQGLVLTGPSPGQTVCPCTTIYSSANDPNTTAIIEENGPAKTVIKATGSHVDASGNAYMQFTLRMYFYRGLRSVKVTSVLRNANHGASNSFATAYKGLQGYEVRLTPNITGTLNYNIATHSAPQTGVLSGSDSAYIYQGQNELMNDENCPFQSSCANTYYTRDTGYSIVKNGSAIASGNSKQYPQGWADIRDASGAGVQVGIYQMAARWPSSLEFSAGGTDVRIGIFARQNTQPVYQAWPAWSIHDLFLNFHDSAQPALENEFLKFQHYLVGRPSIAHINGTGVFPYPIIDGTVEDNYYRGLANTSNPAIPQNFFCWAGQTPCTPDRGVGDANAIVWGLGLSSYRTYGWGAGGPGNQAEHRWSDLMKFYQLGFTGRFLNSAHFYRFLAEKAWPHADGASPTDSSVNGFTWRSRPHVTAPGAELNGVGRPNALSANADKSFVAWMDYLHFHWHGITDFYFMTGDETIREAILPMKDWYLNNDTYQGGSSGGLGYTRAIGIELMSASRFSEYLQAIGDSEYANVLEQATTNFNLFVKPDACVNGEPGGCTPPSLTNVSGSDPNGVSRVRGVPIHSQMRASWCNTSYYRIQSYFQPAILVEGLLFLRKAKGAAWTDHKLALDLAYGISQWALSEVFGDDGSSNWKGTNQLNNGFRYGQRLDIPEVCPDGTAPSSNLVQVNGRLFDSQSLVVAGQTVWPYFYAQHLVTGKTDWERKFAFQLNRVAYSQGSWPADFGGYSLGSVIGILNNPGNSSLVDVPFTVVANGGGTYTLSWTVPAGAQSYRIKWSPKIIAPSNGLLGFSSLLTNTFALSPATHATWFGANDVPEPPPGTAGSTQSLTIATGTGGLATANFSVKAYIQGAISQQPPARLDLISGNGQTGPAGSSLSNPFIVKVTDGSGSPVSGVSVTFTVTAGGGSMTAAQAVTDALGLASSTLILGATPGLNSVAVASGNLSGSPITFTATAVVTAPQPTQLVIISGNGQTGPAGTRLSPFVVKVTDTSNNPVSGVSVTFTVTGGGGSLSAVQVATDALGQASTTLTLGPAPGLNTVLAASTGLGGDPAVFNATAVLGQSDITWTLMPRTTGWPGYDGWITIWYDSISRQTILYGVRDRSSSIYSTDIFFYKSETNTWTHLGGTGSMVSSCPADTPDWPGDRHPGAQMAIDTKRNVLWMYGGPNQTCSGGNVVTNGTAVTLTTGNGFSTDGSWTGTKLSINGVTYIVASVIDNTHLTLTSNAGVNTTPVRYTLLDNVHPRQSMYYMTLNPDPLNNKWQKVSPAHISSYAVMSAMVYDPDDDVLFSFGYDGAASTTNHWVYCPTTNTPTPGVLTGKQIAAGCAAPDDWSVVSVAGGVQPPGVTYPGMIYDTASKKAIAFGGMDSSGTVSHNQTWAYDIPTKTWTRKALSTSPPPVYAGSWVAQPAMVYIPATNRVIYHQTSNTGAPADWEYDPTADTWTKLVSSGGGAETDQYLAFDSGRNVLIGFNRDVGTGAALVWQGAISTARVPFSPCDLNHDGVVNALDTQSAIFQTVGSIACSTADLNRDGACNGTDIQRFISVSLGTACTVGPN